MEVAILSERTIRTVKSSAPILRERGVDIARRMYEILVEDEDEDVKALFDQSHHGEAGAQPRALAGALHAYAENVDRLDELVPMIERIAQKHVALGVLPEHYPVVGRALLGALREVLGQAATDEVMEAWAEAYEFLAGILTAGEHELYDQRRAAPGGWTGWREFVVARVVRESEAIASFHLEPADGGPVMDFAPGQYLTLRLDVPGHGPLVRNYTVSSAPGRDSCRITVKREDAPPDAPHVPPGLASGFLHDHVGPGARLQVRAPAGDFAYQERDSCPVVLLSRGIGLTPMLSILETLVEGGSARPVWYVHAALDGRHHAMKERVRALAAAHEAVRSVVFYELPAEDDVQGEDYDVAGRITLDWIKRSLPVDEADFYFCGSKDFMQMLALGLRALGVREDRIHFEFFGPAQDLYA